ncbi:hypothetical protein [Rhizobium sp. SL42]|uniref:hypothetical protein n=1 Tax=Rhizobium sp. SL42 TaxID=2806346 RepID=UPI001F415748|nr:hypothetical protein [Rhizobium sp. SL42]UJW74393.1 hypothetical protein IM739_16230 [Rhizobium sp. SL42]
MRSMITGILLVYSSCVYAHEPKSGWQYDAFCCNGNQHTGDCQMIPSQSVRIIKDGYLLTLGPGEHRLVTRRHIFNVPQVTTRRSEDSEYHLCLYPNEDTLRCFYAPDMSF